jgi:amidase
MTDDEIRALVDDAALRSEVPAVEQAEAFLERLERAETMHVMTTITPELALRQAREVDVRRRRGERLPLDGMAIVLKDNIDVAGVPTTVGSRLFADRRPTEDAEVTRRLREAGAVILGKANMHELAFGATSANEAFGAVPPRRTGFRVARAAARAQPSPPTCVSRRSGRTPEARSGCRLRSVACRGFGRRTAPSRTGACNRCPPRSTPSAHWHAQLRTSTPCSPSSHVSHAPTTGSGS